MVAQELVSVSRHGSPLCMSLPVQEAGWHLSLPREGHLYCLPPGGWAGGLREWTAAGTVSAQLLVVVLAPISFAL